MKVCDRHFRQNGETVMASDKVIFQSTNEEFDLCLTCSDEVREFIQNRKEETPKKPGRPARKNKE
jgi:hypothetical protein